MKKTLLIFFLLYAVMAAARTVTPFNDNWTFRFAHQFSGEGQRVDIPHTWNASDALSGKKDYYRGMGVYEKKLHPGKEMEGKRLYMRFEGVNHTADVFVNSRYAGGHKGGYGAFVIDITDLIDNNQENIITVKTTNALNLETMPLVGDFNIYGGIYRDVNLIAVDPLHISLTDYASPGVYLTQEKVSRERADVKATAIISNLGQNDAVAKVTVTVMNGNETIISKSSPADIKAHSSAPVDIDLTIEKPRLWNGREDPFMYRAIVELADASGRITDRIEQPLGLRYYSVDPEKGFSLNGKSLRLKGVCRHQDRAERGNALLPMHHEEDAAIIKEIGANAVRLAHYPQASQFYDLMDRYGMVVWAEIPFIGPGGYHDRGYNNLPAFRENGKEQLRELIRQHYNHPSICFWGLFNELKTTGDNPTEYIEELNAIAHKEDPSRLTTAASFLGADDPINSVTDLIAWNQYFGWYGGNPSDLGSWLDNVHTKHPGYKIGLSEYGAGASIYHQQDSVKRGIASGMWHPENYQTYYHMENWKALAERPFVWGSFVWNLFDFGAAHRTEGDRYGINDKGLVTFDRKTKKDAFYFYKANWNKEDPFVYIANRRHIRRTSAQTTVTVFSNLPEVRLIVNGKDLGVKKADGYGTFTFDNVVLNPGSNEIKASARNRSTSATDRVTWQLL